MGNPGTTPDEFITFMSFSFVTGWSLVSVDTNTPCWCCCSVGCGQWRHFCWITDEFCNHSVKQQNWRSCHSYLFCIHPMMISNFFRWFHTCVAMSFSQFSFYRHVNHLPIEQLKSSRVVLFVWWEVEGVELQPKSFPTMNLKNNKIMSFSWGWRFVLLVIPSVWAMVFWRLFPWVRSYSGFLQT